MSAVKLVVSSPDHLPIRGSKRPPVVSKCSQFCSHHVSGIKYTTMTGLSNLTFYVGILVSSDTEHNRVTCFEALMSYIMYISRCKIWPVIVGPNCQGK